MLLYRRPQFTDYRTMAAMQQVSQHRIERREPAPPMSFDRIEETAAAIKEVFALLSAPAPLSRERE